MNNSSSIFTLHRRLRDNVVKNLKNSEGVYLIVVGAPAAGKSTLLRNIQSELHKDKFNVLIATPGVADEHARDVPLKTLLSREALDKIALDWKYKDRRTVIVIDDFDKKYDASCEDDLREYFARADPALSIVATSTTPVISGEFVFSIDESASRNWSKQQEFFYGSVATMPFIRKPLRPHYGGYLEVLDEIVAALPQGNLSEADRNSKLANELLRFAGPFPPSLRAAIDLIEFDRMDVNTLEETLADHALRSAFASNCLDNGVDISVESALRWTARCNPDSGQRLARLASTPPSQITLEPGLARDLASACLVWETSDFATYLHSGPSLSTVLMVVCCGDAASIPRTARLVADDVGGGKLIVEGAGKVPVNIDLSTMEFTVLQVLKEGVTTSVANIGAELIAAAGGGQPEAIEIKVRSALARLVAKISEADSGWIIENIPRRGYVLHLTAIQSSERGDIGPNRSEATI